MSARPSPVPPWSDEDALPHERAVWRPYEHVQFDGQPAPGTGGKKVSIELGDGSVFIAMGHLADWRGCKRWRFGWPPRN